MDFKEWAAQRVMSGMEREFARDAWRAATENAAKICEKLPETGLPGDGPWFNNDMVSAAFDCANAIRSNAEVSGAGTASAGLPGYAGDNN